MGKSQQAASNGPHERQIGEHACGACGHNLLAQRVTRKLAFEKDGFVEQCRCPKCGHINISTIRFSEQDLALAE